MDIDLEAVSDISSLVDLEAQYVSCMLTAGPYCTDPTVALQILSDWVQRRIRAWSYTRLNRGPSTGQGEGLRALGGGQLLSRLRHDVEYHARRWKVDF